MVGVRRLAFVSLLMVAAGAVAGVAEGLVVEKVTPRSRAEEAGIQSGDLLVSWRRDAAPPAQPQGASGLFSSPFDAVEVAIEQAPRGTLWITVERRGNRFEAEMPPGWVGLRARPRLPPAEEAAYVEGRRDLAGSYPELGLARWRKLAAVFADRGRVELASWMLLQLAVAQGERGDVPAAQAAYEQAFAAAAGKPRLQVLLAVDWAQMCLWSHLEGRQSASLSEALELNQRTAPDSLLTGYLYYLLGMAASLERNLDTADSYFRRALALQEKVAPGSWEVARSLHALGTTAIDRRQPRRAQVFSERALAIRGQLAPQTVTFANTLVNLGIAARHRGDLAVAEDYYLRALRTREQLDEKEVGVAVVLLNLGTLERYRGNLSGAETYTRRAFHLLQQDSTPAVLSVCLHNLGTIAREHGNLEAAEEYLRQALAIEETLNPESNAVAVNWRELGLVAQQRGDLGTAEEHLRRALSIGEAVAPRSINVANTLEVLADLLIERDKLSAAEEALRRGLALHQENAPGSGFEARSAYYLGRIFARRGRPELAGEWFVRAIDAIERQHRRLGGSDRTRAGFAALHMGIYRTAIEFLIAQDRAAEAFHVLERSRARAFLALLAERDLVLSDISPELDLEREQLHRDHDEILAQLEKLSAESDSTERNELLGRWRDVERRQDEIKARIRAASPRLASLHYPEPLDLAATREWLDPGTVLLAYTIGDESSFVFVIGPAPQDFEAVPLSANAASLREDVERLRTFVQQSYRSGEVETIHRLAAQLTETLLTPARDQIARAERVLILPDGPLHYLPFTALRDPAGSETWRYLIEARPVHVASSATVFAELKQRRRERRAVRVAAFGDPVYPAAMTGRGGEQGDGLANASPTLRGLHHSGFALDPLPSSQLEVESLRRLFPRDALVFTRAEATEERAKTGCRESSIIHFACHGLVDDRSPLGSTLALSIPESWQPGWENGLLQAWEVFEQVRIDADLVTLSACQTGLGRELAGEGLLGLTRAFQFAGARAVVASLWSVSDESTAELMRIFYGQLKDGVSTDEALRRAQIALLRGAAPRRDPDVRHPFYWAAFQLMGDWR